MQRLNLAGNLIELAAVVRGETLHLVLQVGDRRIHFVDAVGALLDKVLHHSHVHVVGLLHARNLVLQGLNLGLQLDHLLAHRKGRNCCREHHRHDCQTNHIIAKSHSSYPVGRFHVGQSASTKDVIHFD